MAAHIATAPADLDPGRLHNIFFGDIAMVFIAQLSLLSLPKR